MSYGKNFVCLHTVKRDGKNKDQLGKCKREKKGDSRVLLRQSVCVIVRLVRLYRILPRSVAPCCANGPRLRVKVVGMASNPVRNLRAGTKRILPRLVWVVLAMSAAISNCQDGSCVVHREARSALVSKQQTFAHKLEQTDWRPSERSLLVKT